MPATDVVAPADVVIGLSGILDRGTALSKAVEEVQASVAEEFASGQVRILIAENRPADLTAVQAPSSDRASLSSVTYDIDSKDLLHVAYHGLPGRVHALRALLETARAWDAKACVILDASGPGVVAERVRGLLPPLLTTADDFVTPCYSRHLLDGAITKSMLSPMFRTLFRCPITQPAAREFGCSRTALHQVLAQPVWEEEGQDAAIDIWMTAEAVCDGLRICEAHLPGAPRAADEADLSTSLAQVAGSLFVEVEQRASFWQRGRSAVPISHVGTPSSAEGPEPEVDAERLAESFRLGYSELKDVWGEILPPMTLIDLKALAHAPTDRFRLDDRLWARIVYDFALGHRLQIVRRDHLLGSLTPLYLGWLSSYAFELQGADRAAAEARLERTNRGFEAEKPYFISRWRWPERLRS